MNKLKTLILLLASTFALCGCFDGGSSQGGGSEGGGGNVPTKTSFTLGETFRFDDLDLTFTSDFLYTKVDNQFSEHYNKKVLGIPVKMTNKKSSAHSLNIFYYECYGPKGTKLNNPSAYFDEATSVDWGGDLLSGATATRYMYCLYDGDGSYNVLFNNFKTKITVSFNVTYVEPTPEPEPELDKAFVYDGLEMTFSSSYEIVIYQPSQYSNKREVVKMPVTVKNVGTKANSLGNLDVNIFDPSGVETSDMCPYYMDVDAVEFAGSLQPGSSYTKSMYFEYQGDGEYRIEFGLLEAEKVLKFNIQKTSK